MTFRCIFFIYEFSLLPKTQKSLMQDSDDIPQGKLKIREKVKNVGINYKGFLQITHKLISCLSFIILVTKLAFRSQCTFVWLTYQKMKNKSSHELKKMQNCLIGKNIENCTLEITLLPSEYYWTLSYRRSFLNSYYSSTIV